MKHPIKRQRVLTLVSSVVILCIIALIYFNFKYYKTNLYTISVKRNVVTVDCGEILSAYEPLEFFVPLKLVGFSRDSIQKTESTCQCTVPEIQSEDKSIRITYRPYPDTVNINQIVTLIPKDKSVSPKFIRITGKIIPAWFAQPSSILLDNIFPGEKRLFSADVQINYKTSNIYVSSIELNPKTNFCSLTTRITGENKFTIEGYVDGLPQTYSYSGNIEINFGAGPFRKFALPIKINHIGTITAKPDIVTLERDGYAEAVVEFAHFEKCPLNIEKIDCPAYFKITPLKSKENKCIVKIEINKNIRFPDQITSSKVRLKFTGMEQYGEVHVMIIPNSQGA